jgi:WD40 repeat protein
VLYDWSQKKVIERWQGHEGDINVLVQGNDLIFSGSRDKTVRIWKRGSSEALRVLKGHEMNVTALDCFFTDSGAIQGSLVSGSRDATVRLWDTETGAAIGSKRIYRNLVTGLCALRDDMNQTFVQISEDLTIRTWDIRSMDVVNSIAGLINIPTCVDVSKDPNIFMIGSKGFNSDGCSVTVWDRRKNQIIRTLEGHSQTINACAFLSNNN